MSANDSIANPVQADDQQIWDMVRHRGEHRAIIEQAKGMVMFVFGVDADSAFDLLRRQSQDHNIKLRVLAEHVVTDLVALSTTAGSTSRLGADGAIRAAGQRVADLATETY